MTICKKCGGYLPAISTTAHICASSVTQPDTIGVGYVHIGRDLKPAEICQHYEKIIADLKAENASLEERLEPLELMLIPLLEHDQDTIAEVLKRKLAEIEALKKKVADYESKHQENLRQAFEELEG
jgi:hypothetical protein